MGSFVALYRGNTVSSARLIAVSADEDLVSQVAAGILGHAVLSDDPVVSQIELGRQRALRAIRLECAGAGGADA